MSSLREFLEQRVKVITTEGKLFIGKLEGYDQSVNIVLTEALERIIDPIEDIQEIQLDSIVIRGDNVVCIGLIDLEEEESIDYSKVHAKKLKSTKNPLI